MKRLLVFGASNSKNSINKKFAAYAASQIENTKVDLIDLNDFEMPIYSIDREKEKGIPDEAHAFKEKIKAADAIIISFAEHNGSYTVAFKNILDWTSRIEKMFWYEKPMLLLSASPGGRGGRTVLAQASGKIPFMNGQVIASFSLPAFHQNFSEEEGVIEPELNEQFETAVNLFSQTLANVPVE